MMCHPISSLLEEWIFSSKRFTDATGMYMIMPCHGYRLDYASSRWNISRYKHIKQCLFTYNIMVNTDMTLTIFEVPMRIWYLLTYLIHLQIELSFKDGDPKLEIQDYMLDTNLDCFHRNLVQATMSSFR